MIRTLVTVSFIWISLGCFIHAGFCLSRKAVVVELALSVYRRSRNSWTAKKLRGSDWFWTAAK